jgi:hypothetical protein
VKIDGSKLEQIGHIGVTISKSVLPADMQNDERFVRAMLNNVIDQLILALVAPAVSPNGLPLSADLVPEIHKRLLDERTIGVSLVISEVK